MVRTDKSEKIRKNTPAVDKKRNKLRNDDLVYMYPGWAGVDGGTYR